MVSDVEELFGDYEEGIHVVAVVDVAVTVEESEDNFPTLVR